jgi:hypothetical protein
LGNLEEMHKFLDTYDHSKLNQEGINHLYISITCKEIEATIRVSQNDYLNTINSANPQTWENFPSSGVFDNSFFSAL